MRIMHCCLAAFYIDKYGYQENILPKMHKRQGHTIRIIASTETYTSSNILGYTQATNYINEDGIHVARIPYSKWLPHFIMKKLRIYVGLYQQLDNFTPDIIFLHDIQFIGIIEVVRYAKKHPNVIIFADGHTDFINSARNWVSKNILHKIIYKWCAKKIEPYVKKFWGVTPLRVEFFKNVYGINEQKVDLLVMGIDDSVVDFSQKEIIRKNIRDSLGCNETDLVIITGGKIDKRKNIHILMQAVNNLKLDNVKLIVFGSPTDEMKIEIETLAQSKHINYIGWLKPEETYNYFFAADLAIFPGTHSVLWEQALGTGLPSVFRKWDGMEHINMGGNCLFLETGQVDEIVQTILYLLQDQRKLIDMKYTAETKGIPNFSYSQIAKRAIS